MARARNIKPGFFANELLAELSFETRLLFIGLWTIADREGRLDDRPKRIKAQIFPYDDGIDVNEMIGELQDSGFLIRYEVGGQKYAQIVNFTKHQTPHHKEVSSEIPPPDGMPAITRHGYDVTQDQRIRVFTRDGHACLKCGAKESLTIDHITPLSKGGDNSNDNLQTLCSRCNSSKGDATRSYRENVVVEETGRSNNKHYSTLPQSRINVESSCPSDSLIPDSLIPDTGFSDSKQSAQKTRLDYSLEQFEEFWRVYPNRPGSSKADSLKAWKARVKDGAAPEAMIQGAAKYSAYCVATATEHQFIKQPSTFLGPGKHYESDWAAPARASPRMSVSDASKLSAARAIFGTEIEVENGNGRIIDITPTATRSLGG